MNLWRGAPSFSTAENSLLVKLVELVDLDVGTGFLLRLVAGYSLHVVGKHPEGNLHYRRSGGVDRVAYLARASAQVDAGSCSHTLSFYSC